MPALSVWLSTFSFVVCELEEKRPKDFLSVGFIKFGDIVSCRGGGEITLWRVKNVYKQGDKYVFVRPDDKNHADDERVSEPIEVYPSEVCCVLCFVCCVLSLVCVACVLF